jgi:Ca2+-binding EF-hand superfamily protein
MATKAASRPKPPAAAAAGAVAGRAGATSKPKDMVGDGAAIKVAGCVGKQKYINMTYEKMSTSHNNKPCWAAGAVTPMYLFHTGKSRWVISKNIDDGARCYAFLKDEPPSPTPAGFTGQWVVCTDNNEWVPDEHIHCTAVPGSNDPFIKLRMSLEDEMTKYGLVDTNSLKQLWRRLDSNGNNVVSLAEIDKLAVDMTTGGSWPEWMNSKPALMRAYKKTTTVDGDNDDWVEKHEFHALLLNMFWFGHLFQVFQEIDSGHDRRIDIHEFQAGLSKLGLQLSPTDAQAEFKKIDTDNGGQILFVEFCAYIRHRVNPDHDPSFDADVISGEHSGQTMRKKGGDHATHGHFVAKKCLEDFDKLENKLKETLKSQDALKKAWTSLDFNGNGIASLAEVDKWVLDQYPLLNHKPALMRAFQRCIKSGNGDDWVEKKEFKSLLMNLFYFNKLFWLFDKVDEDRDQRLTFKEFKWCLNNCGWKGNEAKAQAEFKKVDKNGGGIILFAEFCTYFTEKMCPECMTPWTE